MYSKILTLSRFFEGEEVGGLLVVVVLDVGGRIESAEVLKFFDEVGLIGEAGFIGDVCPTEVLFFLDDAQQLIEAEDAVQDVGGEASVFFAMLNEGFVGVGVCLNEFAVFGKRVLGKCFQHLIKAVGGQALRLPLLV